MNIFKDKKVITVAIVLFLFTIVYFVSVNKVSYAFSISNDSEYYYEKKIEIIKSSALKYADENKNLFKNEDIIYIKVQDLVDNNLMTANENGDVINPINSKSLNSKVIKIKKAEYSFEVEIDS